MSLRLTNSKKAWSDGRHWVVLDPLSRRLSLFLDLKGCCDDTLFVPVCAVTEQNSDLMSLSTLISHKMVAATRKRNLHTSTKSSDTCLSLGPQRSGGILDRGTFDPITRCRADGFAVQEQHIQGPGG